MRLISLAAGLLLGGCVTTPYDVEVRTITSKEAYGFWEFLFRQLFWYFDLHETHSTARGMPIGASRQTQEEIALTAFAIRADLAGFERRLGAGQQSEDISL